MLHQSLGSILRKSCEADIKIAVNWVLGFSNSEGCTVPKTLSYLTFSPPTWSSFPVPILKFSQFTKKAYKHIQRSQFITRRCGNETPLFLPSKHAPIMTLFLWDIRERGFQRIPFHFVPQGREFTKRLDEDCLSDTASPSKIVHCVRFPRLQN